MQNQDEHSTSTEMVKPLNIIYCHTYEDSELAIELERHLIPLKRLGLIATLSSINGIFAGSHSRTEIHKLLNSADVILLLISPDFISRDDVYETMMDQVLERFHNGLSRVIAIILRPVLWELTAIRTLPILPTNGKPITLWPERDEAFQIVTKGISDVIVELLPHKIKEHLKAMFVEKPPTIDGPIYSNAEYNIVMVPTEAIKVYFCFADQDATQHRELEEHLAPLKRAKWITTWSKNDIYHAQDRDVEIATHLDNANIILLLISPDFINELSSNTNSFSKELHTVLAQYRKGKVRVVAILLYSINWEDTLIKELPVLPIDGKPISSWLNRDEALRNVVEGILRDS